ncbi:hypothetical protein COU80_02465 [Candidatus Peregrinibacteria bacterium CG10_big_fil_rev_8_21_14_0_10_55_24]|nr:MAG: hypothetical protein COU80_02465 [Candidatus Peregrinibacteria bacterium CG10_big_fil_rev_8_21_14_0_10_55_24]
MTARSPLFVFLLGLFLVSCGGSTSEVACVEDYWDGTVGVCLPEGWSAVDAETLRLRGVPTETIAAFRAGEPVSGQFPTVTVTAEPLSQVITPADYSDASIRSVTGLPGYTLIDEKDMKVDDNDVRLHVFSSQPVEGEPARRFYQVSTVQGEYGYTATAAVPTFVSDDIVAQILAVLEGVTFVGEPIEEE